MAESPAGIQHVQALLKADMAAFKPKFRQAVTTDVALLDTVMRYILRQKGKQMRPMFVFLSARLHGGVDDHGQATDRTHTAAALIELLHTATLVHDDVVDESPLRRGVFSIQALWKKKVAVLVGDYLLSRGLLAAVDAEAYDLLKITSRAVREMSEGELLQIEKARRLDITEEVYFDIIRRKTASLLAACCACGAAAAGADQETVARMWGLGERVGLAFQIQDDLLDLGEGDRTGKPTGQDIRERKMTLPLIHTLAKSTPGERRRLIRLVKHRSDDPKAVQEVNPATGAVIREFTSATHAARVTGFSNGTIGQVCNGKVDSVDGRVFRFRDLRALPCSVCGSDGEANSLLLCDGMSGRCPSTAHFRCVGLDKVPEGDWFCASCQANGGKSRAVHVQARKRSTEPGARKSSRPKKRVAVDAGPQEIRKSARPRKATTFGDEVVTPPGLPPPRELVVPDEQAADERRKAQMDGWTTASLTARDTGVSSECSSLNAVALSTTQKRCICRWPTG